MILDGNLIKEAVLEELATKAEGKHLRVCFLQFGHDSASTKFIGVKMKTAEMLGIHAEQVVSNANNTDEAIVVMEKVIVDKYDGIVVQLPVPAGIDSALVLNTIPIAMDIDVLSDAAMEAFSMGKSMRMPPVAAAIELILRLYKISPTGKNIVIRGKGKLVGEPMMKLFDLTAIPYHAIDINTPEAEQLALLINADIIISGIGVPHALTPDMIKDGAVLIDAGTSEQLGKIEGDIDPVCASKAVLFTPVPGGVGPITVACLFKNLFLQ
jgi:methylenetetrahydrofolate dehydrogenase (NADP+)/methenyltetrahydrofolate cyclohydrolase